MHELSLSSAIVETVERHADGRRVTVVSMRIGALRQVVPDSLAFYFEIVARGTVCEGARLDHEASTRSFAVPTAIANGTRRPLRSRATAAHGRDPPLCRAFGVPNAATGAPRC